MPYSHKSVQTRINPGTNQSLYLIHKAQNYPVLQYQSRHMLPYSQVSIFQDTTQRYFSININPDTTLSVSILYFQCQSGHNFICINTLLSISTRTRLYLYQYFTFNINPDTTLSVSILYFQYQPGHNFICINTLLSISIRT